MPLLIINADKDRPVTDGGGDPDRALAESLAEVPPGAPIVVLVHGYKFSPKSPAASPHAHILSQHPREGCRTAISWPRHLGFGRGSADEGLCIAFGWEARGTIWHAWNRATEAGAALDDLMRRLNICRAGPVDIVAHSLGARVALDAVARRPAGTVGRVILLAAAEFRARADEVLRAPAGRTAEFVNVTSRENDLYDSAMEWLLRPYLRRRRDRALGAGLGRAARNWLDLQIDCALTRAALADQGFRIAAPSRRVCHWSAYLRPGLFAFHAALLRDRDALPLDALARALPDWPAPRWSRLMSPPALPLPPWPPRRARDA